MQTLGGDYPDVYLTVKQIVQDCEIWVPIGDGVSMNAYATIFYSLYRDGGYVGVIVGAFILGCIMKYSYELLRDKSDMQSYVIYFLIVQQIFFSMARFYFVLPTRAFSYVWALLLLTHIKTNKRLDYKRENSEFDKT